MTSPTCEFPIWIGPRIDSNSPSFRSRSTHISAPPAPKPQSPSPSLRSCASTTALRGSKRKPVPKLSQHELKAISLPPRLPSHSAPPSPALPLPSSLQQHRQLTIHQSFSTPHLQPLPLSLSETQKPLPLSLPPPPPLPRPQQNRTSLSTKRSFFSLKAVFSLATRCLRDPSLPTNPSPAMRKISLPLPLYADDEEDLVYEVDEKRMQSRVVPEIVEVTPPKSFFNDSDTEDDDDDESVMEKTQEEEFEESQRSPTPWLTASEILNGYYDDEADETPRTFNFPPPPSLPPPLPTDSESERVSATWTNSSSGSETSVVLGLTKRRAFEIPRS